MLRFLTHSLWKAVVLLTSLTIGCGHADSNCTSRRCLANLLIKKEYLSQPQNDNCTHQIKVPLIEYQTLSVDTKNLRLLSRLQASLEWMDPELRWDTSVYQFDHVVLPVDKVWTPEIHVTNGITTTMKHSSCDLVVTSNGTVKHSVIINAMVDCEVNLFNYPFASDECPVAIQTWAMDGCGTDLVFGRLRMVDGSHGDWRTDSVALDQKRNDRNFIKVGLSIKYANPFITLLLPSILIILADAVSFALPLGGGERNSFKVTLVLSFTMFLIILNDQLPGDSQCSPIIRIHFCVCLVLLVVSMLVSMVLTRLAKDGSLIFCCFSRGSVPENTGNKEEKEEGASLPTDFKADCDISVVQLNSSEEDSRMLRKVVNFVEALNAQTLQSERNQMYADRVDKAFFWVYLLCGFPYFCGMTYVMGYHTCTVDHFNFWDE